MHIEANKADLSLKIARRKGYRAHNINDALPDGIKIKGEPWVLVSPEGKEVRRAFAPEALYLGRDRNCEACWLYDMNAAMELFAEMPVILSLDKTSGMYEVRAIPTDKVVGINEEPEVAIAEAWLAWQALAVNRLT